MSLDPRICHSCGATYTPRRHDQKHCNRACNRDSTNRESTRGGAIYRELYHYFLADTKQGRQQQADMPGVPEGFQYEGNMGVISRAMRHFIAEDRAKGRMPPPFPPHMETRRRNAMHQANSARLQAAIKG